MTTKRSWNMKNSKTNSKRKPSNTPITYLNPLYTDETPTPEPLTSAVDGAGREEKEKQNRVCLVGVVLAAVRKSVVVCHVERGDDEVAVDSAVDDGEMEIGWPTDVRHVAHVTFDRFNGFVGLPVEFEFEVAGLVPCASANVFGASIESMQLSYDAKGNLVPTILLLMQDRLYKQGGLKAEGIFRINPENSKEEFARKLLNKGILPESADVYCLASLIKAWFRELPLGGLDGLSTEEVLRCNTEEESFELVKQLKPINAALLNWSICLMADVVQEEESNKMDARNIAMVFAPNMSQMSDPLTALMHAVQVMNLLKNLILKTIRERAETREIGECSSVSSCSSDLQSDSQPGMDAKLRRGLTSDYDENAHYSNISSEDEDEDEVGPIIDVKKCFLRLLRESKTAQNNMETMNKPTIKSHRDEYPTPQSCSSFDMESGTSSVDGKNRKSGLSASYESRRCTDMWSSSGSCSTLTEMDMDDKVAGSVSTRSRPLFAST